MWRVVSMLVRIFYLCGIFYVERNQRIPVETSIPKTMVNLLPLKCVLCYHGLDRKVCKLLLEIFFLVIEFSQMNPIGIYIFKNLEEVG